MNKGLALISGIGVGAALMYALDPDRGKRRRAIATDKVRAALNTASQAAGKTSRDLRNRTEGLVHEVKSAFQCEQVTDEQLRERVRSALGHVVSHPGAIEVTAEGGKVTLGGPILAYEVLDLLACVRRVRGVTEVENQLEVHDEPGNVPSLQGGERRTGERFELFQENWSPTARLLVGAAGGALAAYGAARRDLVGTGAATVGLGMLARGVTNTPFKEAFAAARGQGIHIRQTIDIDAPVEEVFEFWKNYENLPRFMSNVKEVQQLSGDRTRWKVTGPADTTVEWEAVTTEVEPNRHIAWKSVPGSIVESQGDVKFEPRRDGGTRVEVDMNYNPPAGSLGHGVAKLFDANPKRLMSQDLQRLKSLLEIESHIEDSQGIGAAPTPRVH